MEPHFLLKSSLQISDHPLHPPVNYDLYKSEKFQENTLPSEN